MRQLLSVGLMVLAGCAPPPADPVLPAGLQVPDPVSSAFDTASLARTPCFGRCPVYSVTVHADGRVSYQGERWVTSTGEHTGQADPRELEKLHALLRAKTLPLLADYRPGRPACGTPVATDLPGADITIEQGGETRTLHYYQGCRNVPDWLTELAAQIDRAAVSSRWVEGDQAPQR